MATDYRRNALGREDTSNLSPLPEITVDIPRSPLRTNTNDTLSTLTENASPATLTPGNQAQRSHIQGRSTASSRTPNPGRSRAASEATLAPPSASAAASIHSKTSAFTLESSTHPDALRPDPGCEDDFAVLNNKFAFSPGQLNKMLNPKSLAAFIALGGLPGLETGLRTDVDNGLSIDETELPGSVSYEEVVKQYRKLRGVDASALPRPVEVRHVDVTDSAVAVGLSGSHSNEAFYDRKRVFSDNRLPTKKPISFLRLVWNAYYKESVLILLTVAAVISLALGLYETFGVDHGPGMAQPGTAFKFV